MSTTALFALIDGDRRRIGLNLIQRADGTYYARLPDWALSDHVISLDIVTTPEPMWRRVLSVAVRFMSQEPEQYRATTRWARST